MPLRKSPALESGAGRGGVGLGGVLGLQVWVCPCHMNTVGPRGTTRRPAARGPGPRDARQGAGIFAACRSLSSLYLYGSHVTGGVAAVERPRCRERQARRHDAARQARQAPPWSGRSPEGPEGPDPGEADEGRKLASGMAPPAISEKAVRVTLGGLDWAWQCLGELVDVAQEANTCCRDEPPPPRARPSADAATPTWSPPSGVQ